MQEQSAYISETENLMQRTLKLFSLQKNPCIITIPQVLFNWSYFQNLWLLFFQLFCKDAFSFQTPIDCLTEPVLQDWAVPEYCWNCLNILPPCNFRMERDNQNLDLTYIKFTFYLLFLQAYDSCIFLPV